MKNIMNSRETYDLTQSIILTIKNTIKVKKANLHEPYIDKDDINSVVENLKSSFVSSVGKNIEQFEQSISEYTKSSYVVAMCNGTSALHISLLINNVKENDEVLVPALTFIATANAISYCNAIPHFVDSEAISLGIDIKKLELYLEKNTKFNNNECINLNTGRRISAIIAVHVFGFIGDMVGLQKLADKFNINFIEDATEALGSFKNSRHAGTFGNCSSLSFNGNKIITTGGGGALLTNNLDLAKKARHLSTTAKLSHNYEYDHDEIGYNYRMPALNASLGISQLNKLPQYIEAKQKLRDTYLMNFQKLNGLQFFQGPKDCNSNNWLNAIKLNRENIKYKGIILEELNEYGYACRPIWRLLNTLKPYKECPSMDVDQANVLQESLINIPSSPILSLKN